MHTGPFHLYESHHPNLPGPGVLDVSIYQSPATCHNFGYNKVQWGRIRHLRHLPKLAAYMFSTLEGSPDTRALARVASRVGGCSRVLSYLWLDNSDQSHEATHDVHQHNRSRDADPNGVHHHSVQ
ncbi:hypothetical protein PCANC_26218 [Puccinia coronata f. sp. avenae]|uniref:Uncharacterized protein n=1 Tax=Puccinia coronata f. sp. avenae TaxID=200324 RepID=A0A2N5RX63_9BASI|nr:hypothetical protein PCANC_26218 [Puccinia coronata f. sp. avenae]